MLEGVVVVVVAVVLAAAVVDMLGWVVAWVVWIAVAEVVAAEVVARAGCTFLEMRGQRLVGFVVVVGGIVKGQTVGWVAGRRSSMMPSDLMILLWMAAGKGRTVVETAVGIAALRRDVGRWVKQR
jgi:hypothetical protein